MNEKESRPISEDIFDIIQGFERFQKSHNELYKTSLAQRKAIEKMKNLLKIAAENQKKQNDVQKKTDQLVTNLQSIIDNLMSVKVENENLKQQLKTQDENLITLHKEFDREQDELKEQSRTLTEFYEEKIKKIMEMNSENEAKIQGEWLEVQKNWENEKKQMEEEIDKERQNTLEKNDVIKATIRTYEEQLKLLKGEIEKEKYENVQLEKRNSETIEAHKKKTKELEEHYFKMMEDVCKEMNQANEATTSHPNLNPDKTTPVWRNQQQSATSDNIYYTPNTTENFDQANQINLENKNVSSIYHIEEKNNMAMLDRGKLAGLSNWQQNGGKTVQQYQHNQSNIPSTTVNESKTHEYQHHQPIIPSATPKEYQHHQPIIPSATPKEFNMQQYQHNVPTTNSMDFKYSGPQIYPKPISSLQYFSKEHVADFHHPVHPTAKKIIPLQTFPSEDAMTFNAQPLQVHPLYANNQRPVTMTGNVNNFGSNSGNDLGPIKKGVQFSTKKRKL